MELRSTLKAGEEQGGGGGGPVPEGGEGCGECSSQAAGHLETARILGESLSAQLIKSPLAQLSQYKPLELQQYCGLLY